MLRIALCDDLQDQLEIMKTAVQTYYQNKASNIEIYAYNNAMNFVDAVEERKDFDSKKIIFRLVGGGIQVEEVNHLLFVESNGHVQQVHTYDGSMLETRQSLSALLQTFESIVPGQFVSPGKGYIVNQSAIHIIKSEYIEVKGHKIPLAKRKYRQFQEDYFKLIFQKDASKNQKKVPISLSSIFVRKNRVKIEFSYRKKQKYE